MLLRAVVVMAPAVASVLGTATPASASSLDDCAQRVIRDWYSGGRVDKLYPLPCYRAAIRALPDDVLQYSDASAAIERALENARHRGAPEASRTMDEPDVTATGPRPAPPAEATSPRSPPPTHDARRADPSARLAAGPVAKTAAPGIPYPLIALGALSAVLLVCGVATGLAHSRR